MKVYDFSPLYRSSVGFDRLANLAENALGVEKEAESYPPYDIEAVGENAYRITLAVAGFGDGDLDLQVKDQVLTVTGKRQEKKEKTNHLHRGIKTHDFVREFQLADHVRVDGAGLDKGLLTVDLIREIPEAMKPRTIKISTK